MDFYSTKKPQFASLIRQAPHFYVQYWVARFVAAQIPNVQYPFVSVCYQNPSNSLKSVILLILLISTHFVVIFSKYFTINVIVVLYKSVRWQVDNRTEHDLGHVSVRPRDWSWCWLSPILLQHTFSTVPSKFYKVTEISDSTCLDLPIAKPIVHG